VGEGFKLCSGLVNMLCCSPVARSATDGRTNYDSTQCGGPHACNVRTVQFMKSDISVDHNESRFKLIRLRRISLATLPRYGLMDGYQYIYCLPPAGVLHSQSEIIKCAAYGVAQGRGQRYGFININDMYTNDVGKGGAQGCEAYEVK